MNKTSGTSKDAADKLAELVSHARLALGNAVDLGLVQGVGLVLAFRSLFQQAAEQPERVQHPSAQQTLRDFLQMPA